MSNHQECGKFFEEKGDYIIIHKECFKNLEECSRCRKYTMAIGQNENKCITCGYTVTFVECNKCRSRCQFGRYSIEGEPEYKSVCETCLSLEVLRYYK